MRPLRGLSELARSHHPTDHKLLTVRWKAVELTVVWRRIAAESGLELKMVAPTCIDLTNDEDDEIASIAEVTLLEDSAERAASGLAHSTPSRSRLMRRRRRGAECVPVADESKPEQTPPEPSRKVRKVKHGARRKDWDDVAIESGGRHKAFVYIIENVSGAVYTGSAEDPWARLRAHNAGRTRSTRSKSPWRLAVVVGPFISRTAASRFESLVKQGGGGVSSKVLAAERALATSPHGNGVSITSYSPNSPS